MPPGVVDQGGCRYGTKFKLFPQPPFLPGFESPETVWVSSPPGSIGPGPSDERMYAVYPIGKPVAYGERETQDSKPLSPPWEGPAHPLALPNDEGHFDHLEPGTPQFEAAHFFGTVRFVLDIWESYFGRPIRWHFRDLYDRMELVITPSFPNATMGYGFMEAGGYTLDDGEYRPFSLNFDVIAHEVGHSIIYPEMGLPNDLQQSEYFGFHEAAADTVALISSLHFESVVSSLLERTAGNLYALNRLNRIAELSPNEQLRVAANNLTLSDFTHGWTDEHELSQPLTGALFDTLVDIFHELLLAEGLIDPETEELSDRLEGRPEYEHEMQWRFDEAYERNPQGFAAALVDARDYVGTYLADSFRRLAPDGLTYAQVRDAMLTIDCEITGGELNRIIRRNFAARDIGYVRAGPRLTPPNEESHFFSPRTELPDDYPIDASRFPYRERRRRRA